MVVSSQKQLAERLQERFESAGAMLSSSAKYKENYNLDFIVNGMEDIPAHVNLGVFITPEKDNFEAIQKFAAASKRGIIHKAVYIEIHEEFEIEAGSLVAFGVCLSVLFDRKYQDLKALSVKIQEDCSFVVSDLNESVERLENMVDDDTAIGDELDGRIIAYFVDKGFGFVQNEETRKYFFHIANVVDDDLRARLPEYTVGEIIPVVFQYGGTDGKKYPKAINVSLTDEESYFDYESDY